MAIGGGAMTGAGAGAIAGGTGWPRIAAATGGKGAVAMPGPPGPGNTPVAGGGSTGNSSNTLRWPWAGPSDAVR